jgi:hypothetical protein
MAANVLPEGVLSEHLVASHRSGSSPDRLTRSSASAPNSNTRRRLGLMFRLIGGKASAVFRAVLLGFVHDREFNPIVGRTDQILPGPEIFFRRLDRGMTEE